MSNDEITRLISEVFASNETPLSWSTPLHHPDSFDTLVELPSEYDFPDRDGYRMADYGCGDGTLIAGTSDSDGRADRYPDAQITGYDISTTHAEQNAMDYVAHRPEDRLRFYDGDLMATVPGHDPVDWGDCINALHAVRDPQGVLDLIYENIVDGGYLALTLPGADFRDLIEEHALQEDPETQLLTFGGSLTRDDLLQFLDEDRLAPLDIGDVIEITQFIIPEPEAQALADAAGFTVVDSDRLALAEHDIDLFRDHIPTDPNVTDPCADLYILRKEP